MYINAVTESDKIDVTRNYYFVYFNEGKEPEVSGFIDGSYVAKYIQDMQSDPEHIRCKHYEQFESGKCMLTEVSPETDLLAMAMEL